MAWWVFRRGKDTADDYFLAGRNLGWFIVGASIFSSNIGSEHLVGLAGSGAPTAWRWPITSCTPGACWCWRWVFVPFYTRSMVFTMPEFLERRFSPARRAGSSRSFRWWRYVVTKIRRRHLRRRRRLLDAAARDAGSTLGGMTLNAFWIGSIAVVLLTGLYTMIGGLRAVAYTDTLQTIIFIVGSALVTVFGLIKLGGWDELRAALRLGHVQPLEAADPAGIEGHLGAGQGGGPHGLVLQHQLPLAGHVVLRARSSGCGTGAPTSTSSSAPSARPNETIARAARIVAALMKLLPVFIFIMPGMICFALARTGRLPGLADDGGRRRAGGPRRMPRRRSR